MSWEPQAAPSRLAEVSGALSAATDLADGFRPEQAVRTTVLATAVGTALGLDSTTIADVFWGALLRFLGCTAFATEEAFFGAGDDIGLRSVMGELDGGNPSASIGAVVRGVGAGRPLRARVLGVTSMLKPSAAVAHHRASCEVGQNLGQRLGLSDAVVDALGQSFTRFDGKGFPPGESGEDIGVVARVVAVAEQVAVHADRHGADAARAMVSARAGGWFDPRIVATLLDDCGDALVSISPGAGSVSDPDVSRRDGRNTSSGNRSPPAGIADRRQPGL